MVTFWQLTKHNKSCWLDCLLVVLSPLSIFEMLPRRTVSLRIMVWKPMADVNFDIIVVHSFTFVSPLSLSRRMYVVKMFNFFVVRSFECYNLKWLLVVILSLSLLPRPFSAMSFSFSNWTEPPLILSRPRMCCVVSAQIEIFMACEIVPAHKTCSNLPQTIRRNNAKQEGTKLSTRTTTIIITETRERASRME